MRKRKLKKNPIEQLVPAPGEMLEECFSVLNAARDQDYFNENWEALAEQLAEALGTWTRLDAPGRYHSSEPEVSREALRALLDQVRSALIGFLKNGNYATVYEAQRHFEAALKSETRISCRISWTVDNQTKLKVPSLDVHPFGLDSLLWRTFVNAMRDAGGLWHELFGVCEQCDALFKRGRKHQRYHTSSCRAKASRENKT